MSNRKFEILHRESLFQGYFRVDRLHIRQELFEGGWSTPFSREVFEGAKNVAVGLLFDPEQDKIVMIEQFRVGPAAQKDDPFMLEFVAGVIESGETPEQTLRREAIEEADCKILSLQKVFAYYPSPGCTSQHTTLFAGRINAPQDGTICGLAKEGEHIRVHVLDAMKAISLLYSGKLRDASSLIGMQWFALHHTDLRSRWLVSDSSTPII